MALLTTNIKKVDVNKICRICLLHCDVTPLSDNNHYEILIMLQLCFKIQEDVSYSSNICQICSDELKLVNLFIKKLRRSAEIFKEIYQQNHYQAVHRESENLEHKNNLAFKNEQDNILLESNKNQIEIIIEQNLNDHKSQPDNDLNEDLIEDKTYCNKTDQHIQETEHHRQTSSCNKLSSKYLNDQYSEISYINCNGSHIFETETVTDDSHVLSIKHSSICSKNDKRYVCKICNKYFSIKSNLRRHKNVVHEKSKRFLCGICGEQFTVKNSLKHHLYIHTNTKPYVCSICHKSFRQPNALLRHKRTKHVKEKKLNVIFAVKS
ncbi:uncharacterized protein [Diabrotica undecimpunctata]|uniref:uncharacterized protein n=1 Tax=Diabrotica undecimpunctata TaxID=50387 RepID=UPI003B63B6A5